MLSLLLVYSVGMIGNTGSGNRLVLAGMAVSVILTAATQFFISIAPDTYTVRNITSWTMGSLTSARWNNIAIPFIGSVVDRVSSCLCHGHITCFRRETRQPPAWVWMSGGVKRTTIIVVSFVTGVVVAAGGVIGFIGFIVPHIIRILVGAITAGVSALLHRRQPVPLVDGRACTHDHGSTGTGCGHLYRFSAAAPSSSGCSTARTNTAGCEVAYNGT